MSQADLPSAQALLASGAVLLEPEPVVAEAMIEGWAGGTTYKYGTRWYDTTTGTWTQLDPTGADPGYTYTGGDPINRTDPTGRYPGEDLVESLTDKLECANAVLGVITDVASIGEGAAIVAFGLAAGSALTVVGGVVVGGLAVASLAASGGTSAVDEAC